jgi:hypothetical protein
MRARLKFDCDSKDLRTDQAAGPDAAHLAGIFEPANQAIAWSRVAFSRNRR